MPRLSIRGKRFFSECRIFQPPRCPFPRPANPKKARRNADRISTPAGRSGGKHRRQETQETQERQERQIRGAAPGPAGGDSLPPAPPERQCGGNNSPRTPLFRLAASPRGGVRAGAGCRALKRREGWGATQRPEGSADAFRAAISVQACAAAPACRGRPMFRFAATSVLFVGISRFLRESEEARSSGKPSLA